MRNKTHSNKQPIESFAGISYQMICLSVKTKFQWGQSAVLFSSPELSLSIIVISKSFFQMLYVLTVSDCCTLTRRVEVVGKPHGA
jgi:hypothetical protein